MIVAACAGSWLGVGVVVHWPRRKIQIGMGLALIGAAVLMLMTAAASVSRAAAMRSASPARAAARAGRQLRARRADDARHRPVRALHDPGQPARDDAGRGVSDHDGIVRVPDADQQRPVRARRAPITSRRRSGLAIGGLPAALIAALSFTSLPLGAVRWLVVFVVIYTSLNMLLTARGRERAGRAGRRQADGARHATNA